MCWVAMKELRLRLGMAGHGGPRSADTETGGIEAWVKAGARMLWRQGLGFVPGGAVARTGTTRNTMCLERREMDTVPEQMGEDFECH